MTGTFQSAERPAAPQNDKDRARPVMLPLASMLNGAPAVQGLRATAQLLGQHALPEAVPVAGGVIQAKLFRGREEISAPSEEEDASGTVRSLIADDRGFVLRGDEALTDESVHVLSRDGKYLLGERHDKSNWNERTQNWDVDTMLESGKAFPEKSTVVGQDDPTKQDQPLESIHAYLLAVLLQLQSWLGSWRGMWQIELNEKKPEDDEELERLLEEELLLLGKGEEDVNSDKDQIIEPIDDDMFNEDLPDNIEEAINSSRFAAHHLFEQFRELGIVVFQYIKFAKTKDAASAVKDVLPEIAKQYKSTKITMGHIENMMKLPANTTRGKARDLFDKIDAKPVESFVAAVQLLIGEPPDTADPKRIAEVAGGADFKDANESLNLTDPYREAAMIRNVNAARAPLLVKIGNNHVDRVGDAVKDSVKVKIDTDFDALTKVP